MQNSKQSETVAIFKAQIELPRALWTDFRVEATRSEKTARECVTEALLDWVTKVRAK